MAELPLVFQKGHPCLELEDGPWLFDTGAPTSFGDSNEILLDTRNFHLGKSYQGLTAETLSGHTGFACRGLLGADILKEFDWVLDSGGGIATLTTGQLDHCGLMKPLSDFMGIPIIRARVGDRDYKMFLDTGARLSYFQENSITDFPPAGAETDFYPGFGRFQTETRHVPVGLGDMILTLRCGTLPGLLGATLLLAGTSGIIGNEILLDRVMAYFPRRREWSLG